LNFPSLPHLLFLCDLLLSFSSSTVFPSLPYHLFSFLLASSSIPLSLHQNTSHILLSFIFSSEQTPEGTSYRRRMPGCWKTMLLFFFFRVSTCYLLSADGRLRQSESPFKNLRMFF
jgi:hypothetical protein